MFPVTRPRRLRISQEMRDLVSESNIQAGKLIMPVFVDENASSPKPIPSMPGIFRYPLSGLADYLNSLEASGIRSILLFGIPSTKDENGTSAYDENGVVQKSIRIAKENSSLITIADLCMCEYTSHGHCGILKGNAVDNDSTIDVYARIAMTYAEAGVDVVAPSGMMDGQVGRIRRALDDNGFKDISILAYSAKYASGLYGPFRDAADSKPGFGDRKSYQMDPRNVREAMREIALDIHEGADMIMVKPALFYLDVVSEARRRFDLPVVAYSVSGEYTMIKRAVDSGVLGENVINEAIGSIFRAGSDMVITYFAHYLAEKLL